MSARRVPEHHARVYKIVDATQWATLQAGAPWNGAPVDLADGFIHLSAFDQVHGTLSKHFAGQVGLRVLELAVTQLPAAALRWEVSRNGDLFPHLYATMSAADVVRVHRVAEAAGGGFVPLDLQA